MFLKNSSGVPSGSYTMAFVGFSIVSLWLLVSIVSRIGHIDIRPFDANQAMTYLSPLILNYFGRRWTETKNVSTTTTSTTNTSSSNTNTDTNS